MLNIFTALWKSTYSPADIAKTRFQGIGKAILYVFLLSVLFTDAERLLPQLRHRKLNERFQNRVRKRFP